MTVRKIVSFFRLSLSLSEPDCWPQRSTACIHGKFEKASYKLCRLRTKEWISDFFLCAQHDF